MIYEFLCSFTNPAPIPKKGKKLYDVYTDYRDGKNAISAEDQHQLDIQEVNDVELTDAYQKMRVSWIVGNYYLLG